MTAGGGHRPPAPIFETMRVLGGRIPLLARHVERLVGSCPGADLLPPPPHLAELAEAHALRPPADRVLRVEWTGSALRWDDRPVPERRPLRLAISGVPHPGYPVKSVERAAFEVALEEVAAVGADEALLCTADGRVAEAARFSVGWFAGPVLRLPDPALGVLPGIGRIRVLELAEEAGVPVEVGGWPPEALRGVPVFLMNAVRGVVPVSALDGVRVPDDSRVARLAEAFWRGA